MARNSRQQETTTEDFKKGDSNQRGPSITSEETTETLRRDEALDTLPERSHAVSSHVVATVSRATPCTLTAESNLTRFDVRQSSGSKRKADETEEHFERERELKGKQHNACQPGSQSEATQINTTEKRRRNRISDGIRALRAIIPNCNKRDKASVLGDAVEYIKFLQTQLQMMQPMGVGIMSHGLYMSLARQPSMQVPNLAPDYRFVRPSIDMQYSIPQFGSCFPTNIPIFPPSFPGFPPFVPPINVATGSLPWAQTGPLVHAQELQFPSQTSQFVYPTTIPFSDISIPTTFSQAGSTDIGYQPLYHVPMTSQGSR